MATWNQRIAEFRDKADNPDDYELAQRAIRGNGRARARVIAIIKNLDRQKGWDF